MLYEYVYEKNSYSAHWHCIHSPFLYLSIFHNVNHKLYSKTVVSTFTHSLLLVLPVLLSFLALSSALSSAASPCSYSLFSVGPFIGMPPQYAPWTQYATLMAWELGISSGVGHVPQ